MTIDKGNINIMTKKNKGKEDHTIFQKLLHQVACSRHHSRVTAKLPRSPPPGDVVDSDNGDGGDGDDEDNREDEIDLFQQKFTCNYGSTGHLDWLLGTLDVPKSAA